MSAPANIASAGWLQASGTQDVFRVIAAGGFLARAVGGAVRNTLMSRPVADIDIATNALPDDVVRLSCAADLTVHETGLKHGTVTVVSQGVPFEITTLRRDVATDGRHACVAFTTDWTADAARRDFTINALYCDADGTIFDPLGGYPDVVSQQVRFIDDPIARIREDYLRILRFYRFSAIFGDGSLDDDGANAVRTEQAGLEQISAERIRVEILKMIVGTHAPAILEAMATSGVLARVLGNTGDLAFCRQTIELENQLGVSPDPVRRLMALRGNADIDALVTRFRLSNAERDRIKACDSAKDMDLTDAPSIRRALYWLGTQSGLDLAILRSARHGTSSPAKDVAQLSETWRRPMFPVQGTDLLKCGYEAGPDLGAALRRLEMLWIESDFQLTRDALLAQIDPPDTPA